MAGAPIPDRRHGLLAVAFLESVSTVLLERGIYFYTEHVLDFSKAANLWLALVFGVVYVLGALGSHPLAQRVGEKRLLVITLVSLFLLHALLARWHGPGDLFILFTVLGLLHGLKWPLIESYIGAGRLPSETLRVIGQFNVSWALGVPLAVSITGWIVDSGAPWMLFAGAGLLNLAGLWLVRDLPSRPVHLPDDHPERPPALQVARYRELLTSARWSMLASYSLLFLMAPLMPDIFKGLGVGVEWATNLAALLDWVRFGSFIVLGIFVGWHGRALPLVGVVVGLPLGFLMVLFGTNVGIVLVGEVVFGLAAGLTYYAALYYAMVVKNAAVDAGGAHEGMIGAGFAIGPAIGLLGLMLTNITGQGAGMLLGVAPLLLLCGAGAAYSLVRLAQLRGPGLTTAGSESA